MLLCFEKKIYVMLPSLLFALFIQSGEAGWRQGLETVDIKRDALFQDQHPGITIKPLSMQTVDIIGGKTYGVDYERSASPEEREVICKSIMRTAVMHQRMHFFDHPYALPEKGVKDGRYYDHLTACYIVHTATQILEGPNAVTTIEGLVKNLFSYFQTALSYRETALRTLADAEMARRILDVLGRYTQSNYQNLITGQFVEWYKEVISPYPQGRGKYGIKMDELPLPSHQTKVLEVTFRDGLIATYSGKGGLLFSVDAQSQFPKGYAFDGDKGEIVYQGISLDLNLPHTSLQQSLGKIGAKARLIQDVIENLYARKIYPVFKRVNSPFSPNKDQRIKDTRMALDISDVYRTFGSQSAVDGVFDLDNRLCVALSERLQGATIHKDKVALYNDGLELLEHGMLSKSLELAQKARDNFKITILAYGCYLNNYATDMSTQLTINERIAFLRRSIGILQIAADHPQAPQNILNAEANLGVFLLNRTQTISVPYPNGVTPMDVFEESLTLLKKAVSLGHKQSEANLSNLFDIYGLFLPQHIIEDWDTLTTDKCLALLRRSIGLLRESSESKVHKFSRNFLKAEVSLKELLDKRVSGVQMSKEERGKWLRDYQLSLGFVSM